MSLLQVERFAANPEWARVSARRLNRAHELVILIQAHCHISRNHQSDDYYGWIIELKGMLGT